MTIAGILRLAAFSPQSNDLRIMQLTAERLEAAGNKVTLYPEDTLWEKDIDERIIFSMARHDSTLLKLHHYESHGAIVINPVAGIRHCRRAEITRLMAKNHIPVPQSIVLDISAGSILPSLPPFPCWLKRADSWTQEKNDVCFIPDSDELHRCLSDFQQRNIRTAIVCRHIEGDIVKFYGVADTHFFHWYHPTLDNGLSLSGLEAINGRAHLYDFSVTDLAADMNRLAHLAQVPVYGGDCIVSPDGNYHIIDFNDWPSFSTCAEEAADAIARYILKHTEPDG